MAAISKSSRFVVIDGCSNSIISWEDDADASCTLAKKYSNGYKATVAVVKLSSHKTKLFRYDGKEISPWIIPGDRLSSYASARYLPSNLFVPLIIEAAYDGGMDSEWIMNNCSGLTIR